MDIKTKFGAAQQITYFRCDQVFVSQIKQSRAICSGEVYRASGGRSGNILFVGEVYIQWLAPRNINIGIQVLRMAKKQKQGRKPALPIREFPISKHKSYLHNLNAFIKMLNEKHSQLPSRQFLTEVHHFTNRFKAGSKHKDGTLTAARHKIRICKECDGWSGKSKMLQCTLCEDYYHESCLDKTKEAFEQSGLCSLCDNQEIDKFNKQTYLHELREDRCQQCCEERYNREAFVHCLKCAKQFHKSCYGKNIVVCNTCKLSIDDELKRKPQVRQSTLEEWGCSSKKKEGRTQSSPPKKIPNDSGQFWSDNRAKNEDNRAKNEENRAKNEEESRTQPFREKDSFCYNYPEMEPEVIEKYKQGLLFAILAKNMSYTENLQPVDCSLQNNTEESLDFGLDHMTKTEYQTYKNYKKQPIGPFRYVFKQGMGYDVIADREIPQQTLICEYIGQVVTLRRCIDLESTSKNDSIMELRTGCNSDQTLIIRPQKQTNMARFINGVNNAKANSKANVATVRKLAKGIPTVVLFTLKTIKKGDSLLYDYNAGNTSCQYDTSNFI